MRNALLHSGVWIWTYYLLSVQLIGAGLILEATDGPSMQLTVYTMKVARLVFCRLICYQRGLSSEFIHSSLRSPCLAITYSPLDVHPILCSMAIQIPDAKYRHHQFLSFWRVMDPQMNRPFLCDDQLLFWYLGENNFGLEEVINSLCTYGKWTATEWPTKLTKLNRGTLGIQTHKWWHHKSVMLDTTFC